MNRLEKIVYDLLKGNPSLKLKVRNLYQTFFDLLPDKKEYFANQVIVKEGFFYGFHDITPFSFDESYILAHKLVTPLRMPLKDDLLTVGYWDKEFNKFREVARTGTWNYHKGCRLQWLGTSNERFIYNTRNETGIGSSIFSISEKQKYQLSFPIDTVSCDGRYATSFSYQRLNKLMPGYGYACEDDGYLDELSPANTGLFLVDIERNERKLLLSLAYLACLKEEKSMVGAQHFVTHTEFSPDGRYIAFLHRWTFNDPNKRYSRLMTCALDGSELSISPAFEMISHYVWDEVHGILAYCRIDGIDGHYIFKDHTMQIYKRVASSLNSDGHQSYEPGKDSFVTDTYPDRRRYARLYRVNIQRDEIMKIAEMKSPKKYQSPTIFQHWACDLHPRVSPLGNYVCFDSVHTGVRAMCFMKL